MKKIMIVAAAALWGTVAFSVESGNIVGYQSKATKGSFYFTFVVPTFKTVDTNATLNLGDIKLDYSGDDPTVATLWTLTNGGATQTDYYYVNEAAAELFECAVGWYLRTAVENEEFEDALQNSVPMSAGAGIAAVTGSSAIQLFVPKAL